MYSDYFYSSVDDINPLFKESNNPSRRSYDIEYQHRNRNLEVVAIGKYRPESCRSHSYFDKIQTTCSTFEVVVCSCVTSIPRTYVI